VSIGGLDRSFCSVGALVVGGYKVVGHGLGREEIEEGPRLFITEDLNAKKVTARPKEVIGGHRLWVDRLGIGWAWI
jgi:hypothetical protein